MLTRDEAVSQLGQAAINAVEREACPDDESCATILWSETSHPEDDEFELTAHYATDGAIIGYSIN